jgi:transcription antitermination factor NusG
VGSNVAMMGTHSATTDAYPFLPSQYVEPRWYAVYTSARHEKCVAQQLGQRDIEHFLALYESVRRWKDRSVRVQLPLFAGYVFVHIPLCERLRVLQVPGVVRLVGFNGVPAELGREEVEGLQRALCNGLSLAPYPYLNLSAGQRVRITGGPLAGRKGILVRQKGTARVVLSIELIQRSVLVDVEANLLELTR